MLNTTTMKMATTWYIDTNVRYTTPHIPIELPTGNVE